MTDSATADHTATARTSRRALLGAGAVGALLAIAGNRPASASAALSDDDLTAAQFAIALELTARDLYDVAIEAGASDDVWRVMREQHQAYATRLAGISGLSASDRDDATFDSLSGAFESSDPSEAAFQLENTAAATHNDLLSQVTDVGMAGAMASFSAMESRHATVMASLSGQGDDLDALFSNSASPLTPGA